MNWVDLALLGVVVLSGLLAFMRGLVREVLGLGAWLIAGAVASPYGVFPLVQPWMRQQFADPTTADIVAFGGVFVIVLVVLWIIASILSGVVRGSVLGGLDRTLGLVFGLARGGVVLAVVYILGSMALPVEQWPPPVLEARALPLMYRGAEWLAGQMPTGYRPAVGAPPSGRPTTSASLLQSNPTGRAFSAARTRE